MTLRHAFKYLASGSDRFSTGPRSPTDEIALNQWEKRLLWGSYAQLRLS